MLLLILLESFLLALSKRGIQFPLPIYYCDDASHDVEYPPPRTALGSSSTPVDLAYGSTYHHNLCSDSHSAGVFVRHTYQGLVMEALKAEMIGRGLLPQRATSPRFFQL